MARVHYTVYKNSAGATAVSVCGTISVLMGAVCIVCSVPELTALDFTDFAACLVVGLIFIGMGIGFCILARHMAVNKLAKDAINNVRRNGWEQKVAESYEESLKLYSVAPCRKMLYYIGSLNPQNADRILMEINNGKRKTPAADLEDDDRKTTADTDMDRRHKGEQQLSGEEASGIICDFYYKVSEEFRDKLFYGGLADADRILKEICWNVFGVFTEQNLILTSDIYLQVWIRVRGGLIPEGSSPSYIKQTLIGRAERLHTASPEQVVSNLVEASLAIICDQEPELQKRVEEAEKVYHTKAFLQKKVQENAEKNVDAEHQYLNDPEYGYVSNKPIFVNGFGADQAYLSALRTVRGSSIQYKRLGSMQVEGIQGPVDLYDIFIPEENRHTRLCICNYGNHTSQKAPDGFELCRVGR